MTLDQTMNFKTTPTVEYVAQEMGRTESGMRQSIEERAANAILSSKKKPSDKQKAIMMTKPSTLHTHVYQ